MSHPAQGALPAHYREAFEAARGGLPGAPERRAAAFARFAELGFPAAREEAWKYTSLRRLESRKFSPVARETSLGLAVALPASLGANRIVLVNGVLRTDLTSPPPGLTVRALGGAAADDTLAAGILRLPQGGGTERFAALNAALCTDPLLVEVPDEAGLTEPLHVVIAAAGDGLTMSHPRVVIRVGSRSSARIVLHYTGDGDAERFVNAVVDVSIGPDGQLDLYRLQAQNARCFQIERLDTVLAANARLALRDSQLGASLARLDVNVELAGRASECELTGLFLADGSRHLDTHLRVDHRAVETRSVQDYRGVAAGKGRAVFNGKAIVHPGAQKSQARQSSRNLLLSPGAEIDTKPELEIYADDVQCNHGATTGQLDQGALFYLRSRGLSEHEARAALTRAFAGAVLSRIDHPSLANLVHDELESRLGRLLEHDA